jgi:hypothetical protein
MKVWSFWVGVIGLAVWLPYEICVAADIIAAIQEAAGLWMLLWGAVMFFLGGMLCLASMAAAVSTFRDAMCALNVHRWVLDMTGAACEYEAQKRNTPEKVVVRYTADMWSCEHCGDVQMRNARDIEELHIHE